MAAFSTLALLGLGLAGGMAASKVMAPRPQSGSLLTSDTEHTRAGTQPTSLLGGPSPPIIDPAKATAQANAAALRQRKKAMGAGRTILTGQPSSYGINPPALMRPTTLLGG